MRLLGVPGKSGLAAVLNNKGAPQWLTKKRSLLVWQTEDLDIDSISMMTIVVNAEEKFEVTIPDEEVKNLKTVGDAVEFIENAS